jgi:hypothetical protein
VDNEVTQSGVVADESRVARRRILAAGIGGAAVSLLPFLSGRASATATTDGTTTTTAPPKRPTDDDVALIASAQQIELAAASLYQTALSGSAAWTAEQSAVLATIRQSHQAYANSLSGLLGRVAPNQPAADLVSSLKGDFDQQAADVLTAAWKLESAAVATHTEIIGKLQGINASALLASVVVAEARHGTVIADLAGLTDTAKLLVDSEENSLLGNG